MGARIKSWKRRYFVLEDKFLSYYKDDQCKSHAGDVDLAGCQVIPDDSKKPFGFRVEPNANGDRVYHFAADSESSRQEWMNILSRATKGVEPQQSGGLAVVPEDEEIDHDLVFPTQKQRVGINDFELLRVIGRGSFGKVFLVRHKTGGNTLYAMKTLSKSHIIKQKQVQRTKAENRILRQIDSPFVVKLHFAFQSADKLYLILDYVSGGDLFVHLQTFRRFELQQARLYAAEVLLAFEELHKNGIVYRDLKPENILMGLDGHLLLTDFGLSKENMGAADSTNTFCGTPEYLAPEVLASDGYSKEIDWWSLGILIFEMLVGRPPFYSENVNEMYKRIASQNVEFPSGMDDGARDIIGKLLDRDPTKRLGHGEEDANAIKRHPFFASINFEKLLRKEVKSPFQPRVKSDTDVSNFDPAFTSEKPVLTMNQGSALSDATAKFEGFTFVTKGALS